MMRDRDAAERAKCVRVMRSVARQIELFMDDGERTRLSTALALLDTAIEERQ